MKHKIVFDLIMRAVKDDDRDLRESGQNLLVSEPVSQRVEQAIAEGLSSPYVIRAIESVVRDDYIDHQKLTELARIFTPPETRYFVTAGGKQKESDIDLESFFFLDYAVNDPRIELNPIEAGWLKSFYMAHKRADDWPNIIRSAFYALALYGRPALDVLRPFMAGVDVAQLHTAKAYALRAALSSLEKYYNFKAEHPENNPEADAVLINSFGDDRDYIGFVYADKAEHIQWGIERSFNKIQGFKNTIDAGIYLRQDCYRDESVKPLAGFINYTFSVGAPYLPEIKIFKHPFCLPENPLLASQQPILFPGLSSTSMPPSLVSGIRTLIR